MNERLLIGLVLAAVAALLFLIYRSGRRVQQRCPGCHCCGRGAHYGRFVCASCGAHFVLDASGRPCQAVSEVVAVPALILLLALGAVIAAMITGASDWRLHPVVLLLLVAFAFWEIRRTWREKSFRLDDKAG